MKIGIVSLYDQAAEEYGKLSEPLTKEYCELHGYGYHGYYSTLDSSRSVRYSKIRALLGVMETNGYDWLLWKDPDAIIMEPNWKLEDFIDDEYDFIFSCDWALNTGVFFLRNCDFVHEVLRKWDAYPVHGEPSYDQETLMDVIRHDYRIAARTRFMGDAFSAHYLRKRTGFICHMAGAQNDYRRRFIENLMSPPPSYSQYGEDVLIEQFFAGKRGHFLEIGAGDGQKDSNCRRLAELGWTGLCIEPNPHQFVKLHEFYKHRHIYTLCALVSTDHGIRTLHLNNDGLSTTHPDIYKAWIASGHGQLFERWTHSVAVTPDQLAEFYGCHFDFVSIDAEGMDMAIVQRSGRLLKHTQLLCVETDDPGVAASKDGEREKQWLEILKPLGFWRVAYRTQGNLLVSREKA